MRCFVAVEIGEALRRRVARGAAEVARGLGALRLTAAEDMHLTVRFLGEVDEDTVASLESGLEALGAVVPPFAVTLRGFGAFPSPSRPRVVWVGLAELPAPFASLKQLTDEVCAGVGEDEVRPFRPHLTVARVRAGLPIGDLAARIELRTGEVLGVAQVSELRLMRSELGSGGARYTCLRRTTLAGAVS